MSPIRKRTFEKMERYRLIAINLFYLDALLRLISGGIYVYKMLRDSNGLTAVLVAFFFLVNIVAMIVAGRIMSDREKWVYITALSIAAVTTLLIFVSLPDVLAAFSVIVSVLIFVYLIPLKPYYFKEA